MDTLGKFKTNFLKDRSSFKIGFNNRSPLSQYKSTMPTSFEIPKLSPTITKDGGSILVPDNSGQLEAAFDIGAAIGEAGKKIGEAIEQKIQAKKNKEQHQKNVENLPDIYEKWKKENPAGDVEKFKEENYDLVNDYMKQNRHMGQPIS